MEMHYLDVKTSLYNANFLEEKYSEYFSNHKSGFMIAFDFARFKEINDTYGHNIGDIYLNVFGKIIKSFFPDYPDAMLVRNGGDEFIVVTVYSEEKIRDTLKKCDEAIRVYHQKNVIPTMFSFDCGVVPLEENLLITKDKADIMLYHAKSLNKQSALENKNVTFYDFEIFENAKKEENFVNHVRRMIDKDEFTFSKQYICGSQYKILELFTSEKVGNNLFSKGNYDLLTRHYLLKKMDLLNIKKIFSNPPKTDSKILLNINCQTLQAREYKFVEYIINELSNSSICAHNLVLSINRRGTNITPEDLAKIIFDLKKLEIDICIDNYRYPEDPLAISILRKSPIDYIKINREFWQSEKEIDHDLLSTNICVLEKYQTKPIFTSVKNKEEHEYIKKLCPNALGNGKYYNDILGDYYDQV